jgi:hypothetical protein
MIFRKVNDEKGGMRKNKILPTDLEDLYSEVNSTPDGKYIILKNKSGIDVYDLNWELSHTFAIN